MSKLDRLFDECNRRYFRGRKPKYRVVIGHYREWSGEGYCDTSRRTIYLARADDRRTLLHEMCHIGCPYHGKLFRARLRLLAEAGEAWAAKEAQDLAQHRGYAAYIAERVDTALMDVPGLTFRRLLIGLAVEERTTQVALLRRFPWLRGRFRRRKAYWDALRHPPAWDERTRRGHTNG